MGIVCDHAKQAGPFFPGGKKVIQRGFKEPGAFSGGEDDTKGRVQGVLLYLTGVA